MNGPNLTEIVSETYWRIVREAEDVERAANACRQDARRSDEAAEDKERLARRWRRAADEFAKMLGRVPGKVDEITD